MRVEIDRIIVRGASDVDEASLHDLIADAVRRAVSGMDLPSGRTAVAEVRVTAGELRAGAAVADAVAEGIRRSVAGGSDG